MFGPYRRTEECSQSYTIFSSTMVLYPESTDQDRLFQVAMLSLIIILFYDEPLGSLAIDRFVTDYLLL